MHVISQTKLKQFWRNHPNAETSLRYWYKLTTQHRWQDFNDVRQTFPSADVVKNFVVFDIGGNNFRLITYIDFKQHKVFIRSILTHAEYDKEKWKKDDWYQ
ncbi:MAG: type II toxin-antitoxin system HigB family toxin [Waterburya sp.]